MMVQMYRKQYRLQGKRYHLLFVGVVLLAVLHLGYKWHIVDQNFTPRRHKHPNALKFQYIFKNLPEDIGVTVTQDSLASSEEIPFVESMAHSNAVTSNSSFGTPDTNQSVHGIQSPKIFLNYLLLTTYISTSNNKIKTANGNIPSTLEQNLTAGEILPTRNGNSRKNNFILQLKKRIAEDTLIRKNTFFSRNTCPKSNSSALLPLSQSCALKLLVNKVAQNSRNFDFLNNQLQINWRQNPKKLSFHSNEKKLILLWNLGNSNRHPKGCPACELTTDRSLVNPAAVDAIIIYSFSLLKEGQNASIPTRKM
ncbi:hypothetical protein FHG87_010558 [Trinorchestia longiramus]|nr:hypothetical protein FHG87_010558 [Trinorchestia longiramus]